MSDAGRGRGGRDRTASPRPPDGLASDNGPIIICGVGGGNVAKAVDRVSFYGHDESEVGRFEKRLLHDPGEQLRAE